MNFEEEYGAESVSRPEGGDTPEELAFKFKDIKGDEQEITGKLNEQFTSLINKYQKVMEIKGNVVVLISINGKQVKPEGKTVENVLKEYCPEITAPYTQSEIDERVAFHAVVRLRGGKYHN